MEPTEAALALDQADCLTTMTRRTGRWYFRYLVLFAVASFLLATLMGVLGGRIGAAVLTPLFVGFVVFLTVWSQKHTTMIRGFHRLHLSVIGAWTGLWAVTVIVGMTWFPEKVIWWVSGGIAMAVPCLLGALAVHRRTQP